VINFHIYNKTLKRLDKQQTEKGKKNTRTQTAKEEMRRLKKITKWPAQMPANGFTRGSG